MQNTLLLAGLAALGLGMTFFLLRRSKNGQSSPFAGRAPIELDFDAAKMREQKRR